MMIQCIGKYFLYLICYILINQFFVPYIPLPHWLHILGTYPYHTGYMYGAHTLTTLVTCLGLHSISHICVWILLPPFLHIFNFSPCHTYETVYNTNWNQESSFLTTYLSEKLQICEDCGKRSKLKDEEWRDASNM